jgi:hypothetical protein
MFVDLAWSMFQVDQLSSEDYLYFPLGLTLIYSRLERPVTDKHASLFGSLLSYEKSSFFTMVGDCA